MLAVFTRSPLNLLEWPCGPAASANHTAGGARTMSSESQQDEHPKLDRYLDLWARYHFAGGTKHLRCKTQTHWAAGNSDFDTMASSSDLKIAIAMDAIVWDLPPVQGSAVMHVHLAAVFRFNRDPLDVVYQAARIAISAALRRKGIE